MKKVVLIADDSPTIRKFVAFSLTMQGLEVISAVDGMEALEKIPEHKIDLLITDLNMPNMDGQELVDHIRSNSSQASVPVLMVTSESNDNRLAAVQKAGVSAICDKPFAADTVRDLVQQILD